MAPISIEYKAMSAESFWHSV